MNVYWHPHYVPGTVLSAMNIAQEQEIVSQHLWIGIYPVTKQTTMEHIPFHPFPYFTFICEHSYFILPWGVIGFSVISTPLNSNFHFTQGKCTSQQPLLLFQSNWENSRSTFPLGWDFPICLIMILYDLEVPMNW